jgi:hypothetical protein
VDERGSGPRIKRKGELKTFCHSDGMRSLIMAAIIPPVVLWFSSYFLLVFVESVFNNETTLPPPEHQAMWISLTQSRVGCDGVPIFFVQHLSALWMIFQVTWVANKVHACCERKLGLDEFESVDHIQANILGRFEKRKSNWVIEL